MRKNIIMLWKNMFFGGGGGIGKLGPLALDSRKFYKF